MEFKQNDKVIFLYHLISPYVLIFFVLIFIFNRNALIYAIILAIFDMIFNLYNILTTYNNVSLTENMIHVNYLFSKKRSQSIKLNNIVNVYTNDNVHIVGMQPFMNIELRYHKDKNIEEIRIYKGYMSYDDFNKLNSLLMRYSVNLKKEKK
jgi:hypothetical protein